MAQAKGVLPRGEDREVLYKSPKTCGYFVAVKLGEGIDRAALDSWLDAVDGLVARLVERLPVMGGEEKGEKVAAIAIGFAPAFFTPGRFDPALPIPPAGFRPSAPSAGEVTVPNPLPNSGGQLSGVPPVDADIFLYIASVYEARVNEFLSDLSALPNVQSISMDRGYQRMDETEAFGYRDGLRNLSYAERLREVFVHRDERQVEEPSCAEGGTYMTFLRIIQRPGKFNELGDDQARDAVIGRTKDGERLDLVGQNFDPHDEPAEFGAEIPSSAHVRKAGPRGEHDANIFRRGMPFTETKDGQVQVGLHFCSFQASLEQFDVVFNDWIANSRFPTEDAGADPLLDPARELTGIEKVGFFFVPPYNEEGLAAALLAAPGKGGGKPKTGQLVVRKRVVDESDPGKRFERRGFVFQVADPGGQPVGEPFETDSTGRAICPVELTIGQTYTLNELESRFVANINLQSVSFEMDRPHKELALTNKVTQPNTPYGG